MTQPDHSTNDRATLSRGNLNDEPEPEKEQNRATQAATAAVTNWPAITAVVCFSAVMCFMASNLKDGSEALTVLIGGVTTFFALFVGYVFTGKKH